MLMLGNERDMIGPLDGNMETVTGQRDKFRLKFGMARQNSSAGCHHCQWNISQSTRGAHFRTDGLPGKRLIPRRPEVSERREERLGLGSLLRGQTFRPGIK